MKRMLLVALLLVAACGKNDGVRPTGPGYVPPIAPPPTSIPYGGGGNPGFRPQMPQGYPNQYYPFLPIDNYFRQNQQMQQYWQQMWYRWQMYAQQRRYDMYNFSRFWYEFCPQEWHGTTMQPMYNYYSSNVYVWVDVNTQFQTNVDPYAYWANYYDYPYYQGCSYGCY